jgi:hypothetical protein
MINKNRILFTICVVLLVLIMGGIGYISVRNSSNQKELLGKCPNYHLPDAQSPWWIPSQGVSEASDFIDCLGTVLIEKESPKFKASYNIIIRNYTKDDGSIEPGYIVGVSSTKRYRIIDTDIYAFSDWRDKMLQNLSPKDLETWSRGSSADGTIVYDVRGYKDGELTDFYLKTFEEIMQFYQKYPVYFLIDSRTGKVQTYANIEEVPVKEQGIFRELQS